MVMMEGECFHLHDSWWLVVVGRGRRNETGMYTHMHAGETGQRERDLPFALMMDLE